MLIVTTDTLKNVNYEELGFVQGTITLTQSFGIGLSAGFRSLEKGGEVSEYTKTVHDAHYIAVQRMEEQARHLGADAVISLRYSSIPIGVSVTAYGTAVKYQP